MVTYKSQKKMDLFKNIKFFVFCHGMLHLSMLLISIFLKTSISNIEKQFGFSSKMSGILTAVHEVGSTVLVVFVSYFGTKVHRPRVVSLGGFLVAMSGFLTTVPHFIKGPYVYDQMIINSTDSDLCQVEESKIHSSPKDLECIQDRNTDRNVVAIFIFTQLLRGIGMVPIQPFGISYIDDFGSERNIPIYMGILYSIAFIGPALAFVLSSAVLQLYVDIDKSLKFELTSSDPRWVGAWWLGFLLIASLVALSSIPYFFFPRAMPKERLEESKGQESKPKLQLKSGTVESALQSNSLGKFIKSFPITLIRMLRNPIFLFVVIAKCSFSIVISGQATFLAKYMERQFSIATPFANILIGTFIAPISSIGIFFGSLMVKKFEITQKNAAFFCCVVVFISIILSIPTLFLGCSTRRIAGINDNYINRNANSSLVSSCNMNCQCLATAFNPVCGKDGIEYVSPCHAGCKKYLFNFTANKIQNYTDCACSDFAEPGPCHFPCSHLLISFLFLIGFVMLISCLCYTPSLMLVLRTVSKETTSFAVGIQSVLLQVLGWLPGPILFGVIIDSTCIQWEYKCGYITSCQYYDNDLFRKRFMGFQIIFLVATFICFLIAYYKMRNHPPKTADITVKENYAESMEL
ncbi:solute carrier organic anion transporter family member 2B1-like [Pristis pectinata]|uniref:solute carrier organic anion transporter family member 2B1-like n=1 Tax=Pristis pectinata TaxID=685728 RepID=UPI00223CEA04|nr:solute carrier organic anion transporter family member 2B1-like [Pristis pectinata]